MTGARSLAGWLPSPKIQLAIRTTVSALLTYAIAVGVALPQPVWAVVTALVVMQVSVGGTIGAALDRIAGTLGGAAVGAAVAMAKPRVNLSDAMALALAVAQLALLAASQSRFRIAPLTAAIILLAVPAGLAPPLAALERVLEIFLGTLVGIAVSLLVFPARAHTLLARHGAEAMRAVGSLVELHLAAAVGATDERAVLAHQESLRRSIAAGEAAALEVTRERASRVADVADPQPVLRSLRRLRSDAAMLNRATTCRLPSRASEHLAPAVTSLASALRLALDGQAESLAAGAAAPDLAAADAAIAAFDAVWPSAQAELGAALAAGADARSILALPFAIETLRRDMGDCAAILTARAQPRASDMTRV